MQAVEPHLSQRPLALTARDPRSGLVVAAANRLARAAGVRPSMRLAEATGLVDLETREHEPMEDLETLCLLTEQAQQFSPLVGIEQLDSRKWAGRWLHQPECLLLDITGLGNLFGGDQHLMLQVGQWLHRHSYFGCLAVGYSTGAAWALANYALRDQPPSHSGRRTNHNTTAEKTADSKPADSSISSGSGHFNACGNDLIAIPDSRYLLLAPQQQRQKIAQLPLAALRIDQATVSTLQKLGVFRIHQLVELPRAGLASRLGEQLLLRWDQAMGGWMADDGRPGESPSVGSGTMEHQMRKHDEPIVALHGSPEWNYQQDLEVPTDRFDTIAECARQAVVYLARRLEMRGEGALRMVCRLDLVEQPSVVLQLGLFRPTNDVDYLNMLLGSLLDQQLSEKMTAPLWRLAVSATLTAPLVWRQTDLFENEQSVYRHQIAGLVDMLSARLGRKAVLQARLQRESQPELAASLQPLTGLRPNGIPQPVIRKLSSRKSLRTAEPQREDPLRRPIQLFQQPIPIQVTGALRPSSADHLQEQPSATALAAAPVRVKTANGWHEVVDSCGPERLESGWWKGPSCRRDYYRIITHQGSWWWIFRDMNAGQWFLHGVFD